MCLEFATLIEGEDKIEFVLESNSDSFRGYGRIPMRMVFLFEWALRGPF